MRGNAYRRLAAAVLAAAILLGPMGLPAWAVGEEEPVNHALTGSATANENETDYWGADKAIDGVVNRGESVSQNQSRWSTNGASTFEGVAQKDKILTVDLGGVKSFDRLVLEWERTNITQFRIEAAGADQVYRTVYEKTDDAEITSLTSDIWLDQVESAQYVRLTVSGYTAGTNRWASVSLWEFEIWEMKGAQPPNAKPVVVPELAEWTGGQGDFTVTDATRLVVNPQYKTQLQTTTDEFQADYQAVTGRTLTVVEGTQPEPHDFYFTLGSADTDLGEEGYLLQVEDGLTVEALDAQGAYWATRSILQILAQTGDTIPQGTARDYPLYEVRGFMLDVGRKPISYAFLQSIVKEMAWYKMNDFQIHLNDNSFQHEYPNATVEVAKKAYSGFRLESDIKAGGNNGLNQADLTSADMFYTKDQMRTLIQDARGIGIDIVPEIDTPAHSLALTKVRPDLIFAQTTRGVDHLNLHEKYDMTLSFVQSIFNEYMTGEDPVFDQDTIIHVGTDEYDATYTEEFRQYTDDMLAFVQESGRTVRLWGSLSERSGSTPVRSQNVQMNVWNTNWANPNDMIEAGYDIINTDDFKLYIVPGVTRGSSYYNDYLNARSLYETWNPTIFTNATVPAGTEQLLGATFAVWNDKSGVHSNGITEQDIYDRFAQALPVLASKTWGDGTDLTYDQLVQATSDIGQAPNDNPRFQATSVDGTYLSYTFEPGEETVDATANDRDIQDAVQVQTENGALFLQGGESYVQTPLAKLGFGNVLEFDVLLQAEPTPGQILFEADSEYDTHDIRILEDGTLGYTTELYDYSFGYTIPVGEMVHLKIVSAQEESALIVDGVRHKAVGTYTEEETGLELNNIGYPSFVLPLQRIGSKTNAIQGVIDNVRVSAMAEEENPIGTVTADSQHTGNPIQNAFDGNSATFWHSSWDPYQPLPATVTIPFTQPQIVTGLSYLPRQDNNNNGQVTLYDLEYQAQEGGEWLPLVTDGTWAANKQEKLVTFDPVQAVALRFIAKNGTGDNSNPAYACAAEIGVIYGEIAEEPVMKAYAQPAQGGTATVSAATAQVGERVTYTAQANEGYVFQGWYDLFGNLVSENATYEVEVSGSLTLVAHFHQHSYGAPTFEWGADNETAKAIFTCECGDRQEVEADVTAQVTTPATCTQKGVTTYTATVEFGGTQYQDAREVADIPLKDHTEQTISGRAPTCTQPGLSDGVQCSVCETWLVQQQVIPATGHKWDAGTVVTAPTCTQTGINRFTCTTCGETRDEVIPATGHSYADGVCTVCGAKDPAYVPPQQGVTLDNRSSVQITLGNADQVFAPGTVISVDGITEGEIYVRVEEALKGAVADMAHARILEITALLDGKPVQPNGALKVTFAIPQGLSADNLKLFYVPESGAKEEVAIVVDKNANTVTAELTHFSTYVLANVQAAATDPSDTPTGDPANLVLAAGVLLMCTSALALVVRKRTHFDR